MTSLGWAIVGETPMRELVLGTATQPWKAHPVFRPVEASVFAGFNELCQNRAHIARRRRNFGQMRSAHRKESHDDRSREPRKVPAVLGDVITRYCDDSFGVVATNQA